MAEQFKIVYDVSLSHLSGAMSGYIFKDEINMMENLVADLKRVMPFKNETTVGDLIFVVGEDPQILSYALVDGIERDTGRRDEWWHVEMTLLTIPPQKVIWTLRTPQFTGQEIFTMGGKNRFIQAVDLNRSEPEPDFKPETKEDGAGGESSSKTHLRLVK